MYEVFGWNQDNMFFLTRDHTVEITTVGGGFGDVPIHQEGCLFHYGNQFMTKSDEIPDKFGRNAIDRMFIALCLQIHIFLIGIIDTVRFHSLTTRKDGDRYMVRVRYDDVDLEMEVVEMFHYFTEKSKEGK